MWRMEKTNRKDQQKSDVSPSSGSKLRVWGECKTSTNEGKRSQEGLQNSASARKGTGHVLKSGNRWQRGSVPGGEGREKKRARYKMEVGKWERERERERGGSVRIDGEGSGEKSMAAKA